jgi:hypothetical protein
VVQLHDGTLVDQRTISDCPFGAGHHFTCWIRPLNEITKEMSEEYSHQESSSLALDHLHENGQHVVCNMASMSILVPCEMVLGVVSDTCREERYRAGEKQDFML